MTLVMMVCVQNPERLCCGGTVCLTNSLGDDTKHTGIPNYRIPGYWESRAAFPEGSDPEKVDLVFFDL